MLTISQLASFAGVTVRAVRHYHARGLLPEPERDVSGYRRYDAQAAVDLIRIRTLAEAGVPLARVRELLRASPPEFAAALADVDTELRTAIRQAQEHRRRIALLAGGDPLALALPPAVGQFLAELRERGVSEATVELEREGWIMLAAREPEQIDAWIVAKRANLADPLFLKLYLEFDRARDWSPDDPRLEEVVDTLLEVMRSAGPHDDESSGDVDDTMAELLDQHILATAPAWQRIAELAAERGLRGWTNIADSSS